MAHPPPSILILVLASVKQPAYIARAMGRLLRILYTYSILVPGLGVASLGVLVTSLLRMPRPVVDVFYKEYARLAIAVTRARITHVVWRVPPESLPPQLVVVSNHESQLDTMLLLRVLAQRSLRYVAKRQLFTFPLFGWALWTSGNVAVTRGDTSHDVAKLRDARARARDHDVGFFPEGTRTLDGCMAPFKKGAFVFAIQNGRPILPIGIGGTREVLPSHELAPKPGDTAVVIGAPIPVTGLTYADRDTLRDRCETAVAELRREALRLAGSPRAGAS